MKEFLWELIKDPNFLGAFLGALITGSIALFIYWRDKKNLEKEKENERKLLKQKYEVFYRTKCNQIINITEYIKFDLGLLMNHNPYNMEPIEDLKDNITELKNIRLSLLDNNIDYVPLKLYKTIEDISKYIDKITENFSGILATEEDENENIMNLLEINSRELMDLIEEEIN